MKETEPVTEPTEPVVEEIPEPEEPFPVVAVIVGAICLVAGVGFGIGGTIIYGKKKPVSADEVPSEEFSEEAPAEEKKEEIAEETEEVLNEEVSHEENDPV